MAMNRYAFKKVFSLEVSRDNGRLKISASEKSSDDEQTIKHYEYRDVDDNEIKMLSSPVFELLNRSSHHGKINRETLRELQTAGHLLYDSLLTARVKEKLAATDAPHLVISIDDLLVQIPWEIMFDGSRFLCQRFNIGRLVSTSQRISEPVIRKVGKPLTMLVIADPRGDLKASYSEGVRLRDSLEQKEDIVEVHLRSHPVDAMHVKGTLRDFDVLHYAGHADYDLNNPSDSGFLLQDGKLKASDIINMIGPKPLPSMVFSNACKSGHTDMWRVGEDYETEIYGLANAFLLAGVQHYIGTFWDVQDEPSLYFALDFYKELMDGVMIGEAVRKARLRLIERYGEDTVIWASYMLYGDPTVRYVKQPGTEEFDKMRAPAETEETERESESVVRGNIRGAEEVVAFQPRKHKWMLVSALFLLVLTLLSGLFLVRHRERTLVLQIPVPVSNESVEEKEKRIDTMVASLARKFGEDKKRGKIQAQEKKSILPAIAFINIKSYGIPEADNEFILNRIANVLQDSKRVHVVEREVIDKLLRELELSSFELADPETTLRIGRIVSSDLISVGSMTRDKNSWQVSLRFIETETTKVNVSVSEIIETEDKKDVAEMLSLEILKKVRTAYPITGKILSLEDGNIVLDIGYKAGVNTGLKMNIFSGTERVKVGELEITSAGEHTSRAKTISRHGDIREGLRVEELI